MSTLDDLSVLAPESQGIIELGDGEAAWRGMVHPLKIGQLPAFARAVRPLSDRIGALLAGGVTAEAVLDLVEQDFDRVVELLHVATGAPVPAVKEATLDQALGAVLAVLAANKDFLRGRLAAALRTAANLNPGAGPTP